MSNEQARQVLQQGIAAARAGQTAQARQLLQEAARRDPRSEAAWLWLSSLAKDNAERTFCLKKVLEINPNNENALKGLRAMGVISGTEAPSAPPPSIPLPDDRKLSEVLDRLDPILQNYQPIPQANLPVQWVRKRGGRAGEGGSGILVLACDPQ